MHCVKCGTSVPDGAAFCPNCGTSTKGHSPVQQTVEKPAKKSNKVFGCLGIGVAVIILLAVAGSLAPDTTNSTGADTTSAGSSDARDSTPAELPVEVTATELFNAYQNNEASAQDYFGDRKLLVSGTVDRVTLDFMDDPVINLRTPNQFMSAQAALAESAKGEAGNFNAGDKVKLLCEDVREVAATPMLTDCRTAPANMKGRPVKWADK